MNPYKIYLKGCLAVGVFLLAQLVGPLFAMALYVAFDPSVSVDSVLDDSFMTTRADVLILSLILADVIASVVLFATGLARLKASFVPSGESARRVAVAVLAAICGIFACDLLSEQLALEDLLEDQFLEMGRMPLGIITLAILGPIVEELVFREALQGTLLRGGCKAWVAMVVSAASFGLVHMNPAQIPFAFLMGLILSYVYQKTGNIFVTSIIHILNNSLAVVQMNVLGDAAKDFSMTEWVGGPVVAWGAIVVGCVMCVGLLRRL